MHGKRRKVDREARIKEAEPEEGGGYQWWNENGEGENFNGQLKNRDEIMNETLDDTGDIFDDYRTSHIEDESRLIEAWKIASKWNPSVRDAVVKFSKLCGPKSAEEVETMMARVQQKEDEIESKQRFRTTLFGSKGESESVKRKQPPRRSNGSVQTNRSTPSNRLINPASIPLSSSRYFPPMSPGNHDDLYEEDTPSSAKITPSRGRAPTFSASFPDPLDTLNDGWTDGVVDVFNLGMKVAEAQSNPLCTENTLQEFISSKANSEINSFQTSYIPDPTMSADEKIACLHQGFNVSLSIFNEKMKKMTQPSGGQTSRRSTAASKAPPNGQPPLSLLNVKKRYEIDTPNLDFKNVYLNQLFEKYKFGHQTTDLAIGKALIFILKNITVIPHKIQEYTVREKRGNDHLKKLPDEVRQSIEDFILALLGLDAPELSPAMPAELAESSLFYKKLSFDEDQRKRRFESMKSARSYYEERVHSRLKDQFYAIREYQIEVRTVNGASTIHWKNDKKKKATPHQ